jgi:hypothetical protein
MGKYGSAAGPDISLLRDCRLQIADCKIGIVSIYNLQFTIYNPKLGGTTKQSFVPICGAEVFCWLDE